ncbi:MAG: DUF58 domain-containing protein [Planctomycetota bacterium]
MLRTANPTRPASMDDLLDSRLIAAISRLDLTSRKIFAGKLKGERRSKKRGESVEFADHRPYVSGDDLRHIDWNIYGRLDRLFLKLFMEEEDLSLHVVIDASASSDCGEPSKFFYAQQLAMAMGYIGLINLNRVAITTIGGEVDTGGGQSRAAAIDDDIALHTLRDLRGRRRLPDIARFLCSLRPGGDTSFPEAAKRLALSRRGKGVMIVISDFFMKEGYQDGLRLLVGRGYDLFACQVLSPQEVNPDITGDLRLVDVEDGDRAEITVSAPLLKKYKQNLAAYCEELRMFCARREITGLTVQTDTPIEVLLVDYLRRRGMLV